MCQRKRLSDGTLEARQMVGLKDHAGLFQPGWFYDNSVQLGCQLVPYHPQRHRFFCNTPSSHRQTSPTRHKTPLALKVLVANNHQSSVVTSSRPRHDSHAAPSHLWPMHFTESQNIPSWKGPTRVIESSSQLYTGFGFWVVMRPNTT